MMKKFVYKRPGLLAVIWAAFIFVLCATPGQFIPSASWLELLSFDKLVHAGVFFVLAALFTIYALNRESGRRLCFVFLIVCILYGLLLEVMQATVFSNRSADWMDMIANGLGSIAGALVFKRKPEPSSQGL